MAQARDSATQETVRAALQAVVGCAGSVAGGSGNCGSAAAGAAASVVIANLISGLDQTPRDTNGDGVIDALTVDQQNARVNLITTLVAALASGTGLDAQVATTSAAIEAENNKTRNFRLGNGKIARIADGPGEGLTVAQIIAKFGIDNHPDLKAIAGAYGTRDPEQLQAIVNLIAAGKSATEIKAVQADAAAAYGKGTPEAKAALVDVANGRSTPVDLVAHLANVRANYDSSNGAGSYDRLIAQGKVDDAATQARVDAAQARFDKEIACIALCIPAAVASVVFYPVVVGAAGTYVTSATGLAGTSALIVKGGIGGTASLLYTEGASQAIFGHAPSTGERIAAFGTGALFAPGVFGVTRFSAPVNGAVNGGLAGFGGNAGGQAIDRFSGTRDSISLSQLIAAGTVGTVAGGIGGTVSPYYNYTPSLGNSQSILAGARFGVRVQANAAPITTVTTVTQAQLDPVAVVVLCTLPNKADCPK